MQLSDAGGQVTSRPSPVATNAPGWASNSGPPSTPTIADPDWMNAVSAELLEFLTLTGQAAAKTNVAQVATACLMLFGVIGTDSGAVANQYVVTLPGGLTLPSLQDGQRVMMWTSRASTAAATLALGGLAPTAVVSNIVAGNNELVYRASAGGYVAIGSPVSLPAGTTQRLSADLSANGSSVSFTADYINVATALGGQASQLANFSQTLNVAGTGAGGMDIGAAPASGFVSIYAGFDSVTGAQTIFGTTACQTTIYTGPHVPAGISATALIAIWPTDGSGNLVAGAVVDRDYWYQSPVASGALNSGSATAYTAIALSSLVPVVARLVHFTGAAQETGSVTGSSVAEFVPNSASTSAMIIIPAVVLSTFNYGEFDLPMVIAQTTYYRVGQSTMRTSLNVNGYRI